MKTFLSQRIRGNMPFMLALLVIALLAGFTAPLVAYRPGRTTARDFMAFWASARLLRANAAPYNQYQILVLEEAEGWTLGLGQPTRFPPWILPVFIPFSFLGLREASVAWFIFSLFFFIIGAFSLYGYYVNSHKYIWLFLLAFMIYFPVIAALREGQISALLLTALAGFLWAQHKYRDYLAGMCLAILAIKPHLMLVFAIVVIYWIFHFKRWRVLVGVVVLTFAGTMLTLVLSPQTLMSFRTMLTDLPLRYPTPTLVTWMRAVLWDWKYSQLAVVPLFIILPSVGIWLLRYRGLWDWHAIAPPILLLSILAAPYAWHHDWILLLPVIIQILISLPILSWGERFITVSALVAAQIILPLQFFYGPGYYMSFWFPWLLAGLYVWNRLLVRRRSHPLNSPSPLQQDEQPLTAKGNSHAQCTYLQRGLPR